MPFFHVFLQGAVDTEGHLTNFTLVHVFAHLTVGLHVASKFGALSTSIIAQLTLVWSLPCVAAPVHCQVTAVLEHLATKLTSITPAAILGVGPPMAPKVWCAAATSCSTAARHPPIQFPGWG